MKINRIINLVSVFMIAGASMGCQKFLDTSIDTNRESEYIETDRSTVWYFGYAFYSPLSGGFSRIDGNIFATASDEAQQTSAASNVVYFNKGIINENVNPISGLYNNYYEGIRAANFFLDYVKDGKGVQILTQNRDITNDKVSYERDLQSLGWMIAEAHVARAYYYAELIKMYGGVPIIESDTKVPVARSSYDECVDYIISEIDNYKDQLAVDWSQFADRGGRFTLGAALAIKARVLLYAASPLHNPEGNVEKWKKAAKAAADIISNSDLGYGLAADYRNYFLGNNCLSSNETIYAVRSSNSNTLEAANYPIATAGGNSGACPTENLVSQYEYIGAADPSNPYANRDPRMEASIVYNGSNWNGRTIDQTVGGSDDMTTKNASRTGYYLKKFVNDGLNLTQGATAQHNWVAFRYAEVLLNYAEAMNEAFGPTEKPEGYPMSATEAIMMVRNRASAQLPKLNATTKAAFRAAVKHERQIELAFEDHRYWDLLRWKDAMEVLNQPVKGVKVNGGYQVVEVATRTFNERNYYLPFMRSEIQNSNGTLEQNKGY
ncbi:MAG: RagB/SusD family nutrient uptake outer membrane protein [Bacteroidales bacterium]|nr:RagB/SusD family nutrient uptake outer membrane protein [Bacteroidales bacterium]